MINWKLWCWIKISKKRRRRKLKRLLRYKRKIRIINKEKRKKIMLLNLIRVLERKLKKRWRCWKKVVRVSSINIRRKNIINIIIIKIDHIHLKLNFHQIHKDSYQNIFKVNIIKKIQNQSIKWNLIQEYLIHLWDMILNNKN